MRRLLPALLWVCVSCEARVGVQVSDVDADPRVDSPVTNDDSQSDAPAGCNKRTVFLQFEGQGLTDAVASDATQNKASWMIIATGTAPKYHAGLATRDADILAIVDGVRTQLSTVASFPINVVTTRPATGEYVMVVFGGTPQQVGSRFSGAVQELDCGDVQHNDVAWVADSIAPTQKIVNFAIGAIGFGLGLTATTNVNDCMCGWDNVCTQNQNAACVLTAGITRDPAANQVCQGANATQDEAATFNAAFCQ